MSQLTYAWEQAPIEDAPAVSAPDWYDPPPRSIWQTVALCIPLILAAGGAAFSAPILVDIAFLCLTALALGFLIGDLSCFSERFGLGGIVLFGGVFIWFCVDYLRTWFLGWLPHWDLPITPHTVAVAAMYHMLYIVCLTIGLRFRIGSWVPRMLRRLPEPPKPSSYFWIVIATQVIGLFPYVVFTREPFFLAIYHQITAGRNGMIATQWTVGRTGNVNYNWGAYVSQFLEIGTGGGVLASFCLIFLRQNIFKNIICAAIWLLWLALGFGTGTRGEIVRQCLPLVAFVFIRYHVQAQEFLHKYSVRAYVLVGALLFASIVIIQIQARYRTVGFENVKFSDISLTKLEGNEMFSTSLPGFSLIPEEHDFFYNRIPGETIILPIPNFLFWAAVAPTPRALWTGKPIDPSWKWYNAVFTGRSTLGGGQEEGTTISEGIVGYWYFRFGLPGVIEGGLFLGWLLGCAERLLLNNRGRPMAVLVSLAIFSWLFRAFRDIGLPDLVEACVALLGIQICIWCMLPFRSSEHS